MSNRRDLIRPLSPRDHDFYAAPRRLHRDPSFAALIDILDQLKPHHIAVKGDAQIIGDHGQSQRRNMRAVLFKKGGSFLRRAAVGQTDARHLFGNRIDRKWMQF